MGEATLIQFDHKLALSINTLVVSERVRTLPKAPHRESMVRLLGYVPKLNCAPLRKTGFDVVPGCRFGVVTKCTLEIWIFGQVSPFVKGIARSPFA